MRNLTFKKRLLTSSIAVVVASGMSYQAFAQDDAVEEVVVTGIKASLQNAVSIKRDAAGVVDAISSEDIGKMPDANLAESLQRVTGISIDRTDGEGAKITSRGFGPEFNLVTINGRQLSSAMLNGDGGDVDSSRSFDMSNVASESVSGVEIYKTGKASIPTGGIGATVNLKTAKPFDHEGFKASIGGKALYDESRDINEEVTPELSGFASWSNEMFGASLSLTHQERNSGRSGFANSGWGDKVGRYTGPSIWNGSSDSLVSINEPTKAIVGQKGTGDIASRLQEANFFHTDTSRKRQNALLTLQFKPTESITTTLDYLKTTTEIESLQSVYSLWFSDSGFSTRKAVWDNNSITKTPLYVWQQPDAGVRDIALKNHLTSVKNTLEDVGFNATFEVTDELSFELDLHNAKSKASPWNSPGSKVSLGIGVNTLAGQGLDMTGDMPLVLGVIQHKDANGVVTYDNKITKADVGSTISQLNSARAWSEVKEARVTGKYEFADSGSIDFGIDALRTEAIQKKSDIGNQAMKGNWSVNFPGDIDANWYDLVDYSKFFDGYSTGLSSSAKSFLQDAGPVGADGKRLASNAGVIMTGVRVKYFDVVARDMFKNAPGSPAYEANKNDGTDRKINEDINAAFVQTSLDGTLGEMKVNLTAGVRYETTDVESYARISPRVMKWTADRDFSNDVVPGTQPYTVSTHEYANVLPSLDLTFHITDDLIARASSSKTISRPNFADLQQGAWGSPPKGNPTPIAGSLPGDNNDGNVKLKPVESNNIDFSVEYYFNDTDYVSVGFFDKRVPNFIGYKEDKTLYAGAKNPTDGPRAQRAVAELQKRGLALTERNLFQMVASMNDTSQGCVNTSAANLCGKAFDSATYAEWSAGVDILPLAEDNGSINNTRKPLNVNDARLYGWEFAAQHFFGDSGFGLQANYTIVNGTTTYNLRAEPGDNTQFALSGLSDSANLVAIYEKDAVQARIAYNWRDKFLSNPNAGGFEPEFTKSYGQVDFNVGYKITDDFTVSLEGTNVLGADKETFGRTEAQVKYIDILQPRYALSARYNF